MNLNEILHLVERGLTNKSLDFIAVIYTKFHALGLAAWYHQQEKKGRLLSGLVVLWPNPRFGLSVSKADLRTLADRPRIIVETAELPPRHFLFGRYPRPFKTLRNYFRLLFYRPPQSTDRPPLYLISVYKPNLSWLLMLDSQKISTEYSLHFELIDEGIGSYLPGAVWRLSRTVQSKTPVSWAAVKNIIEVWTTEWKLKLDHYLAGKFSRNENFLFTLDAKLGYLQPNTSVIANYRAVLTNNLLNPQAAGVILPSKEGKKRALVLTQPWSETKQLALATELEITGRVIETLLQHNYLPIIKPHPNEAAHKYDEIVAEYQIEYYPGSAVAEAIFGQMEPTDIVVGINSTALLTAAVFYHIRAFSYGNWIIESTQPQDWLALAQQMFGQLTANLVQDLAQLNH